MQWVVTTGRTVADATARALDVLGIDEADLECEVVDEGSTSLFGLRTTPARVRARVRPTTPRPKVDRRTRRTKGRGRRNGNAGGSSKRRRGRSPGDGGSKKGRSRPDEPADRTPADDKAGDRGKADEQRAADERRPTAGEQPAAADAGASQSPSSSTEPGPKPPEAASAARRPSDTTRGARSGGDGPRSDKGAAMSDIALSEQEPTAVDFVRGLVEAFGATAEVTSTTVDDGETLEISVEGDDLGLLVGQKGATLGSIQELTRTAVAQQHSGRLEGRLRVDVAGYRARRTEALVRFAQQAAAKAVESGNRIALEPMSPADRKVVHDAVNEIDGVHTSSEGEDRRRHVVIHPDS